VPHSAQGPAADDARIWRCAGVACARGYAQACITFQVHLARLRRSRNCGTTFSCRRIEPYRRILTRASTRPRAGSSAQNSQLGQQVADPLHGNGICSLRRSAAVRLGLSGAGPQLDRRRGPWMASGVRSAFAAALPRPMYRITCPSRTRLHARSQVLAMRRSLMYRIIRPLSGGCAGSAPAAGHRVPLPRGATAS